MYNFFSKIKNHITGNEFANTFISIGILAVIFCILFYLGKEVGAFIALMTKYKSEKMFSWRNHFYPRAKYI